MTTAREPPWARLPESARRFTLDEVRSLCAGLPRPRTNAIHDVAEPRAAATLVPVVDVAGTLASFELPNGDLLWGTQGEILRNLLEQLVTLREPSGKH